MCLFVLSKKEEPTAVIKTVAAAFQSAKVRVMFIAKPDQVCMYVRGVGVLCGKLCSCVQFGNGRCGHLSSRHGGIFSLCGLRRVPNLLLWFRHQEPPDSNKRFLWLSPRVICCAKTFSYIIAYLLLPFVFLSQCVPYTLLFVWRESECERDPLFVPRKPPAHGRAHVCLLLLHVRFFVLLWSGGGGAGSAGFSRSSRRVQAAGHDAHVPATGGHERRRPEPRSATARGRGAGDFFLVFGLLLLMMLLSLLSSSYLAVAVAVVLATLVS